MTSSKTRYLIFFQYFGTKYSGVMRAPPDQAMLGVQNHLEKAAEKLRPSAPIKFVISSRTDSGVHALCNAAHVDIERATGKMPFSEEVLREAFNRHLKPEPIRGLKFWELEFKGRSFLYKQVRRMVGVLVAVGQNRFEPHHVKRLLEAGENTQNTVAPAAGLFLKNVEYCEDDLEIGRTEIE